MITLNRLAAFLDDAGASPSEACSTLSRHSIKSACISSICGSSPATASDAAVSALAAGLTKAGVNAVALRARQDDNGNWFRSIMIAKCLGCSMVTFPADWGVEPAWSVAVGAEVTGQGMTPVAEPLPGALPAQLVASVRSPWKLLYDPAACVGPDPFVSHWLLLNQSVGAVVLRDRIGQVTYPPGFGDRGLHRTVSDAHARNYGGWYFLEPRLGNRYGDAVGLPATFDLAMEAFGRLAHGQGG